MREREREIFDILDEIDREREREREGRNHKWDELV